MCRPLSRCTRDFRGHIASLPSQSIHPFSSRLLHPYINLSTYLINTSQYPSGPLQTIRKGRTPLIPPTANPPFMQSGATIDHHHASFSFTQSPASPSSPTQHGSLHSGNIGGSVNAEGSGYGGVDDVKQSSTSVNNVKANRIAQYETTAPSPSYGGGFDAGFIITKTDWAGKAPRDSPINRFPNGLYIVNYVKFYN